MEASSSSWESLHRQAKSLEAKLEKKVQSYSSLAQQINANFMSDEENPLIESHDEHTLSSEIEHDLSDLYEVIQKMRQVSAGSLTSQQEVLIKRYYEIHFDYSTEFKNTSATVQRKRDSLNLLHTSSRSNNHASHTSSHPQDSSMSKLLKEKLSIGNSMRSIHEVLSQAFETKQSLAAQRNSLQSASQGVGGLGGGLGGVGRLIDGIGKKKFRESLIVALFVAVLLCFTLWWVFLR
eukprot:gene30315-36629_t